MRNNIRKMDRKGRAVTFFILRGDLASVIRDHAADASNIWPHPGSRPMTFMVGVWLGLMPA